MHNSRSLAAIAALLIFLASTAANALDITAQFNLANSVIANPVTVDGPSDISLDLTTGDVLALDVIVANPAGDDITAIFASLVYDPSNLVFLGGIFSNILTEASCAGLLCVPATLSAGIPSPIQKPNNPFALGSSSVDWIQALAHANVNGTTGTGPDVGVLLAFRYTGPGGFEFLDIAVALTQGDVVGTTGGAIFPGAVNLLGATVNVPEPGTALLMGLGLIGLGIGRGPVRRSSAP